MRSTEDIFDDIEPVHLRSPEVPLARRNAVDTKPLTTIPVQAELFEPEEIVRPELNIAKYASLIFVSPYAKKSRGIRKFEWKRTIRDQEIKASLTVTPLEGSRPPTTTTFRVLLALIQIWEMQGRRADGCVQFSGRQVAVINEWKWGGDTAKRIEREIEVLSGTMIKYERAWAKETGSSEAFTESIKIVGDSRGYFRKDSRLREERFAVLHEIYFGETFLQNLLAGVTKPLNHAAYRSITNDSAANLYTKLDVFLARREPTVWRRRAHTLITVDLELDGKRYEEKKHRLAKLKELCKALDGKELVNGKLHVGIEPTADREDYNLVARKVSRISKDRAPKRLANQPDDWPEIIDMVCAKLAVRMGRGRNELSEQVLRILAMWYPKSLLLDAAGRAKADYQGRTRTHVTRVFMIEVHMAAHERGLDWIKKETCGPECKYRTKRAA